MFGHRLGNNAYDAIRTSSDEVFIEYPRTDEAAYHGLKDAPHQLDVQSESASPKLKSQVQVDKDCTGGGCRRVDGRS